ncbi:hypothetical protein [Thermococcus piezophilus]|uniref:Uncharacterized protein n=1 Tax=Thermococcus piezophilus TaxID=1712654 RepID=A0A172WG69_9EURY|nr:hypothetical protein [Thermococcus piezophilus]ANF22434.1 hypothetical protein A7C91_04055 [Thermococcus piezophilus]
MKKYALVLVLILLTGFTAGCISSNGQASTTPSESPVSESQTASSPTTTHQQTTTTTTTATETPTSTERGYITEELLKGVSGIRQFTYTSNATISMNVTVEQEGISQKDHVDLTIIEESYVDFDSWSAWINSTTIIQPDGASTSIQYITVNNVTYVKTAVGWMKADDETLRELIWKYNIVSLARKYLAREPMERAEGDVLTLRYRLDADDLKVLASAYFASTPDTEISVDDGLLELQFRGGILVGGSISYTVSAKTVVSDPTHGNMTIIQEGTWSKVIKITGINEKKSVKEPST